MKTREKGTLGFLYETAVGRVLLKLLTARWLSKIAGAFCDSCLSKPLIRRFIKANHIDLSEYVHTDFTCFNDCFTRQIKKELRPVCAEPHILVSPCDGLLSAYAIESGTVFPAKQSAYTVASLLQNDDLAAEFEGGSLLVLRLCVQHYHRYGYVDNGRKGENVFIPGKLHTVRPIALENRTVFCENCREYTVMETENFGKIVQCEIGAMLVGKIRNHHKSGPFEKGQEKGMFLYGGSTVVLLVKKRAVRIPQEFFDRTAAGEEVPVKYGQPIGDRME